MSDLIDRQAAIDALRDWYDGMIISSFRGIEKVIKALPSAQPEPCEYTVSAMAVEEMLKDLLPERGMWKIEGDETKTAICETVHDALEGLWKLPFVKPNSKELSLTQKSLDTISRQAAMDAVHKNYDTILDFKSDGRTVADSFEDIINDLPSAHPGLGKYEYHYDHTDCIWYRPEARNRCPATCAQYRDGWNDAMNYIFRDGKGYRPYRRGEQYEK